MPSIGEQAPDFELVNQDGKTVRLSHYRGQKVVIFAFPKANSLGCTTQACGFRDTLPDIQAHNAVVLGISADSPAELKNWQTSKNLQYELLSDPDHKMLADWGAWGVSLMKIINLPMISRSYWLIDENGIVLDEQIGIGPKDSVERALSSLKAAEDRAKV